LHGCGKDFLPVPLLKDLPQKILPLGVKQADQEHLLCPGAGDPEADLPSRQCAWPHAN
jgi:hypothetical protein